MGLPIGFVKLNDEFQLVGILGLRPNNNVLVSPKGSWLSNYIPIGYKYFPFYAAKVEDKKVALAIAQDSGMVQENFTDSLKPFFIEKKLHPDLAQIFSILVKHQKGLQQSKTMCSILLEMDLLEPWEIALNQNDEVINIEGYYRINEQKIRNLDADNLHYLSQEGVLQIAYCQLLSMIHIRGLMKLMHNDPAVNENEIDFTLDEHSGSISMESFDNF